MPSKKRKYNARFPAGRIKKIMQTDEEVGKVAQAVPIIISRTLELFVESLLSKAMQVTMARNAKTLSPSHVKQCILAESRFDFLRDLVKNIPDVSAAEEKEMLSAESSPTSTRYSDMTVPPRRLAREDSNSSSSSDVKITAVTPSKEPQRTTESEQNKQTKIDTAKPTEAAIDLTKKIEDKPVRTANFYQETLLTDDVVVPHKSVIKPNPTYSSPQPSTSFTAIPKPPPKLDPPKLNPPKLNPPKLNDKLNSIPALVPIKPLINIDFSKNVANPEIHLLDSRAAVVTVPTMDNVKCTNKKPRRKKSSGNAPKPTDLDRLNPGNLQIDEDYDT